MQQRDSTSSDTSRGRSGGGRCVALVSLPALLAASPAAAQTASGFGASDVILISALIGSVSFAVITALVSARHRQRMEAENRALRAEAGRARAEADLAETLLHADDQRLVVWDSRERAPLVIGDLPRVAGAPAERGPFLAFGRWLSANSAAQLDEAIARLRDRGEPFAFDLVTTTGTIIEVLGRTVGGRAVAWFRDLTGDRLALSATEARYRNAASELSALKAVLDVAPLPAWLRERDGRLGWVNRAYAAAVEAPSGAAAVAAAVELLDTAAREAIAAVHKADAAFRRRMTVVAAGERRIYDVTDVVAGGLGAGLAVDATEVESGQAAIQRISDFHARTLDQLATAVAIFGPDQRLRSYNAAYRALFGLDAAFLDTMPDESAVLDRLRATRKVPEQADFRGWKKDLLSAYRSAEAREQMWHLPEGQALRVIANPHPGGGMTWIYENVTERLGLESRYNALIRIQGETLDHMRESVAVFGSDGRLRLHNPAFVEIWDLDPRRLARKPHIGELISQCAETVDGPAAWEPIAAIIAGLDESRASRIGRMERTDGRIVDYATVPLPEGQTMVTFVDITDSVRVARALTDRNDALEAADRLKNEFIQHVSYELRSPLTNIIGFTQMIAEAGIGPLNGKQREYLGYVLTSSGALLALVNDILDLATIDAGIMALDLAEVDLASAVNASIEGLRDRLGDARITIETRISSGIGPVVADEKRLRQILYNLLSNAVTFSGPGGRVLVTAERTGDSLAIEVSDEGVGIPDDFIGLVFNRFESRPGGGPIRGGAGLGLAIVKSFVELHGGRVAIRSAKGRGTVVRITFPLGPSPLGVAAE